MSEIQVGNSLDLPMVSKKLYWATLGALFIFIGLVPLFLEVNNTGKLFFQGL